MSLFFIFFYESFLSLREYGKQTVFFVCFLSLSLCGICVVDSAIYSVGKKAENELRIDGVNTVLISFRMPPSMQEVDLKLKNSRLEVLYEKNSMLVVNKTAGSDFPQGFLPVTGIEKNASLITNLGLTDRFNGNVAVIKGNCTRIMPDFVQISRMPFKIIGCKPFNTTSFLDSLGLGEVKSDTIYIPLDTVMRLELDSKINNATIKSQRTVTNDDVNYYKKLIQEKFKSGGDVTSYLNAKNAVENVVSRFGLLSNFIYIFLLISSVSIIVIMCRKMFDERRTEFALKIIHGISVRVITAQVCTEMFIKSLASLVLSLLLSFCLLQLLIYYINVELLVRIRTVAMVYIIVFISGFITSVLCGRGFYKMNPVTLIRGRFC
ncbi:hypothetical protein LGL88_02820 [Yersinia ruckeri]|uniref:FtsX-like permease family protein n=2 Tax=Yersinia ruckeri TaxID=29486 RepID=UPI001F46E6D3|nr:FtsX-like permease family protein [Yersinia ruckeri]UIN07930.1 hypothetical protein LGL88_02820 [Yersinia ruckeri]